ncbi:MAG: hypothetical protein QXQ69_02100 [Candidatus Aenigmatarchaeota archaeon]
MEREEDIEVEFQSTLEEIKEKTGFKKECILDLFIFELCRREKKAHQNFRKHPIGIAHLISLYIDPSLLNYSIVEGPGAPIKKTLHPSSTFLDEEKIEYVDYFCSYFLISPNMPVPRKELKDSILVCLLSDLETPYRIGLINPSRVLGIKIEMDKYDEGNINSQLCTFRKFYGCNQIHRISDEELYEYTKEKMKEKFADYEKRSETLYKIFKPFYETYRSFLIKELERLARELMGKHRTYVT